MDRLDYDLITPSVIICIIALPLAILFIILFIMCKYRTNSRRGDDGQLRKCLGDANGKAAIRSCLSEDCMRNKCGEYDKEGRQYEECKAENCSKWEDWEEEKYPENDCSECSKPPKCEDIDDAVVALRKCLYKNNGENIEIDIFNCVMDDCVNDCEETNNECIDKCEDRWLWMVSKYNENLNYITKEKCDEEKNQTCIECEIGGCFTECLSTKDKTGLTIEQCQDKCCKNHPGSDRCDTPPTKNKYTQCTIECDRTTTTGTRKQLICYDTCCVYYPVECKEKCCSDKCSLLPNNFDCYGECINNPNECLGF